MCNIFIITKQTKLKLNFQTRMKVNTMEDQTLTKCFTYFRMVGIFDPDTISQMLELEPEDSSKIGDIGITGIKFESADWNYGYCYADEKNNSPSYVKN